MKNLFNIKRLVMTSVCFAAMGMQGCMNLSGYSGETEFKCKAPAGIQCQSISGVYANDLAGNRMPGTAQEGAKSADKERKVNPSLVPSASLPPPLPLPAARNMGQGQPPSYFGAIRSDPTIIRTWIMAYKDTDGDIVDQSYVYLTLDTGQWLLQHNEELIKDTFAPSKPVRVLGSAEGQSVTPTPSPNAADAEMQAKAPATPFNFLNKGVQGVDAQKASTEGSGPSMDASAIMKQIQQVMKSAPGVPGQQQDQQQ